MIAAKPRYRLRNDGSFELATHDGWVPVFSRDPVAPHVLQDQRSQFANASERFNLLAPFSHSNPLLGSTSSNHRGLNCRGQRLTRSGQ